MNQRKIKVCVSGHDLKFWMPLQRELENTGRYEFKLDEWSGHNQHDETATREAIAWADVIVAEWALGNAVYCARHKRAGQKLIVRLHQQERRTDYPNEIDFSKVDTVVFVGAHILDECVVRFGIPRSICEVVGNYVDIDKYGQPKMGGSEFNLGMIGTAPMMKRLDLALDTAELLTRKDDRYMLRVKGENPAAMGWLWARASERTYYEEQYRRINSSSLRYKVVFDPQGRDVEHWLKMVGFLLSPSDFESFHMAVAEGGASGAIPVVWNREGVAEIYPGLGTVGSPREAADMIDFLNRSASAPRFREQVKEIIRARYDKKIIVEKWEALLDAATTRVPAIAHGRRRRRLVVVWAIDNWSTFHRREMLVALAKNLRDEADFLIIEPGSHLQAIAQAGWATPEELRKIGRGELEATSENIHRVRLLTGGGTPDLPVVHPQGGSADPVQVLDTLLEVHFPQTQVMHWVYKPDQALRLGARKYIYEVYDDYTMDFGTGEIHPDVVAAEPKALANAVHAFFTSQPLYDRKAGSAKSASVIGNGVCMDLFARYGTRIPAARKRPVAGYLGNLSTFFDWELMKEVCIRMPEVDFVFHGQIELKTGDARLECFNAMTSMPNVRFTGRVSRDVGAAAVNRYDVLLIPFVVNEAIHAVNPLKLWEYLATGKPVVSTPMDAVRVEDPLLIVATDSNEWVAAINRCLSGDAGEDWLVDSRIELADRFTWEHLTAMHAEVLRAHW